MRLWVRHEPSAWMFDQVAVLDRALADLSTLRACTHLWAWIGAWKAAHRPRPDETPSMNAAVWRPGEVCCQECWDTGALYVAANPDQCDRCGQVAPLMLGSHTLAPYTLHALLCAACGEREAPAGTEVGAARHGIR